MVVVLLTLQVVVVGEMRKRRLGTMELLQQERK